MTATARKETPLTEGQLVERLRPRYEGESGNGPAGALVAQVRNAAGHSATRTIDALGFSFWPSRGLLIDGFECKSSRSDWVRELENPAKADAFCCLVDRFYIVAGRSDIVKVDEVPPDWGLLVPSGDKLREVKPPVVMHTDEPAIVEWAAKVAARNGRAGPRPLPPRFDRSFLIAVVREAARQSDVSREIRAARDEGYRLGSADGERHAGHDLERLRALEATVREFEGALGHRIAGHRQWLPGREDITVADVGKTLRAVLDGEANTVALRNRLSAAVKELDRLTESARGHLDALDATYGEAA